MSSTHAEDKLEDMWRSSSVSTSLLLVRSFSLQAIKDVDGNLSVEPLLCPILWWPLEAVGDGVVVDEEAPDEVEAIFSLYCRLMYMYTH
jgi:hypothetical protein